jgi:hypothetical protein
MQTEHPDAEFYLSPYGYSSPFHHMLLDLTPLAPLPRMLDSCTITRDQASAFAIGTPTALHTAPVTTIRPRS